MKLNVLKLINKSLLIAIVSISSLLATDFENQITSQDLVAKITAKSSALTPFAQELVQSASTRRGIVEQKYGQAFPLNPQALGPLMDECEGKVVLELAAAGGQNGLLMLLAGARQVILNDICPGEMKEALARVMKLPKDLASKVRLLSGDCLGLASKIEPHSCDIIIARNVLHLLPQEKHTPFLNLIRQFLKPEGKLYMSVNNTNITQHSLFDPKEEDLIKQSSFCEKYTIFLEGPQGNKPVLTYTRNAQSPNGDPTAYKIPYILHAPYPETFPTPDPEAMPGPLFEALKKHINEYRQFLNTFPYNCLSQYRVIKTFVFHYSGDQIRTVLANHGFETIATGHIDPDGKIFQAQDWTPESDLAMLLAVIAKPKVENN